MRVIEKYQEYVERDSREISFFWKAAQLLFYFIACAAGYASSIMFYIFWQDIFSGNCPLWANIIVIQEIRTEMPELPDLELEDRLRSGDWRQDILVEYKYQRECQVYLVACFLSCMFGAIWFALYSMCGKGGYDRGIYDAPWRIVIPSLFFNIIFVLLMASTSSDLNKGFLASTQNIKRHFQRVSGMYGIEKNATYERGCDIIQSYLEIYYPQKHSTCGIFSRLQILSWIMSWSWNGALAISIIRILIINDFRLLKVTVYELPESLTNNLENKDAEK